MDADEEAKRCGSETLDLARAGLSPPVLTPRHGGREAGTLVTAASYVEGGIKTHLLAEVAEGPA